jgi:hypothetical protein
MAKTGPHRALFHVKHFTKLIALCGWGPSTSFPLEPFYPYQRREAALK